MGRLIDADLLLKNLDDLQGSNKELEWILHKVMPQEIEKCPTAYDVDKVIDVLKRRFDAKFLFAEPKSTDEHIYHGAVMALKILQDILDDPIKHIPSITEIEKIFNRGCVNE